MVFKSSKTGRNNPYQSGIILDIPPGYKALSAPVKNSSITVKDIAGLFIENIDKSAMNQLGLGYEVEGQKIIYTLDSKENYIRKLLTNTSGTVIQYTWYGNLSERLHYARKNNNFTPPGYSRGETKNLYH